MAQVLACNFEVFIFFILLVVGVVHSLEEYALYFFGVEISDDLILGCNQYLII